MNEDDASDFADSMISMYGASAKDMAFDYATKHKRSGDMESSALWLAVVAIIKERQNHHYEGEQHSHHNA